MGVSYFTKNEFLDALDRGNRVQKPIANDQDPDLAPKYSQMVFAVRGEASYASVLGGQLLLDFIEAFNKFSFNSLLA